MRWFLRWARVRGHAMMNALSLAVQVEQCPSVEEGLANWERSVRPHTEYVQDLSRRVAEERMNLEGRLWTREARTPIRVIPTGTEHLPRRLAP